MRGDASGPAPDSTVGRRRRRKVWAWLTLAGALGGIALFVWWALPPPRPRVIGSTQITNDRLIKGPPFTDGSRIYFTTIHSFSASSQERFLAQVASTGGETVTLAPWLAQVLDISPNGRELLVSRFTGEEDEANLWVMPVLGGTPRRLGDLRVSLAHTPEEVRVSGASIGATWSPDGTRIVYTNGSEVRLAKSDGTESRTLLAAPGLPFWPRWSPDGRQLRYSVRDPKTSASTLWEANADGTHAHTLLPDWNGAPNPRCGTWTPDGRYFIFQAAGNIWAIREEGGWHRRGRSEPVQLTFGPMALYTPVPSRDGKRILAVGDQPKGELVRYDASSGHFVPYLSGLSADGVAFSRDGGWVAYVAFPEGTLWRSRVDGTERLQLTFPPLQIFLPRWSPDGKEIAFYGGTAPYSWKIYLMPTTGGKPCEVTTGEPIEWDPSWSPDGRRLAFGSGPASVQSTSSNAVIHLLDLQTGEISKLPGSQGLFAPRYSPDGRYLGALSFDLQRLLLFEFSTRKWTELYNGLVGYPSWSSDGRYLYFDTGAELRRARISDHHVELVASIKGFSRPTGDLAQWFGLAPDDSPLVLRDMGTHEIYALDWEAP